jgi:hypothetical protein
VTTSEALQLGPNALRERPKVRAALGMLAEFGWVAALDAGTEVRGTPRKEAWRIVRGLDGV